MVENKYSNILDGFIHFHDIGCRQRGLHFTANLHSRVLPHWEFGKVIIRLSTECPEYNHSSDTQRHLIERQRE